MIILDSVIAALVEPVERGRMTSVWYLMSRVGPGRRNDVHIRSCLANLSRLQEDLPPVVVRPRTIRLPQLVLRQGGPELSLQAGSGSADLLTRWIRLAAVCP